MVEVVDETDLTAMGGSDRGTRSASYNPAVLLGLLVQGYAIGVFSSRTRERATYDSVGYCFIAANDHPDNDTIPAFRWCFLMEIEVAFVRVLRLVREMVVLGTDTVALDRTKNRAEASRHNALLHEHARKIDARLQGEVADPAPSPCTEDITGRSLQTMWGARDASPRRARPAIACWLLQASTGGYSATFCAFRRSSLRR